MCIKPKQILPGEFFRREFTLLNSIKCIKGAQTIQLGQYLDGIAAGRWKDQIHRIRSEANDAAQRALKEKLPAAKCSGVFSDLDAGSLNAHSGLLCVDIDHLGSNLDAVRLLLSVSPYVCAHYQSSRGAGLKVIVAVDAFDEESHQRCWTQVYRYLGQLLEGAMGKGGKIDTTPSNVTSNSFVSFDPSIWVRSESVLPICAGAPTSGQKWAAKETSRPESVIQIPTRRSKASEEGEEKKSHTVSRTVLSRAQLAKQASAELPTKLARIYAKHISGLPVVAGRRNSFLTSAIPTLYERVSEPVLMSLLLHHYDHQGVGIWKTSRQSHEKAIRASLRSYRHKYQRRFTAQLRDAYNSLKRERDRAAFRISCSLATYNDGVHFFLGDAELGARIGSARDPWRGHCQEGSRRLAYLLRLGLIRLIKVGNQRGTVKPGTEKSTEWAWCAGVDAAASYAQAVPVESKA